MLEVHGLERVFRRGGLPLLNAVFEKIHKDFALVHMHPNNSCGEATCHDITLPRVLEMTYLRKDRVHQVSVGEPIQLPHPLDQKNVENMDDIELPEIWWKQP